MILQKNYHRSVKMMWNGLRNNHQVRKNVKVQSTRNRRDERATVQAVTIVPQEDKTCWGKRETKPPFLIIAFHTIFRYEVGILERNKVSQRAKRC
jgi:hypothetical protein